jgi:tol-pal system protein YbgF
MRKQAVLLAAMLALIGCASQPKSKTEDFVPIQLDTGTVSADARLEQMQASLTELLERLDVLNDRIAKLEAAPPQQTLLSPGEGARRADEGRPPAALPVVTPKPEPVEAPATAAPAPAPETHPAPVAESGNRALRGAQLADDYRNALMLYGKGRAADSRAAFQAIFDAEPGGDLADNALYWIGETYFAAGDYANAMRFYSRVTKEFGDQNKAPDAMFKTGLAYERTGDLAMARQTFDETIKRYPYSTPAASARLELKRIRY